MAKVTVKGVLGLDGEYELHMPPFTQSEWHEIKVKTGLRPLDLEEAFAAGDTDTIVALTWVALTRAGIPSRQVWGSLWECDPFAAITMDFTDEEQAEADAVPPASTTLKAGSAVSEPGTNGGEPSSGDSTKQLSDRLANAPTLTGDPT